jgi:hypothetical protein
MPSTELTTQRPSKAMTARGQLRRVNVRVRRSSIPGKMAGWLTQFILGGVIHRRFFSDSVYGSAEAAFDAAFAHASACQDEHDELLALRRALSLRKSNSSGMTGVFHSPAKPGRGAYWTAYWLGPDGRRRSKKFSESLYAPQEARRLAIDARATGVAESMERFAELCRKFRLDAKTLLNETTSSPSGANQG